MIVKGYDMEKGLTKIEIEVEYSSEKGIVKSISRKVSVDGMQEYSDTLTPALYGCDSSPIGTFTKWLLAHKKSESGSNVGGNSCNCANTVGH